MSEAVIAGAISSEQWNQVSFKARHYLSVSNDTIYRALPPKPDQSKLGPFVDVKTSS